MVTPELNFGGVRSNYSNLKYETNAICELNTSSEHTKLNHR